MNEIFVAAWDYIVRCYVKKNNDYILRDYAKKNKDKIIYIHNTQQMPLNIKTSGIKRDS